VLLFKLISPLKSSPFIDDRFFISSGRILLEALFIFRYYMHMNAASQQKNRGDDKHWLVMNELGERFGPVNFETLKLWAKDGRLAPTNTVSEDEKVWTPVTHFADLEMVWVAEVSPGAFYGPIHKQALEALKKEGAIPADAITFQRAPTDLPTSKTQVIPAPASPPPKKEESDAVPALERQLSLERQRSHDIMKQLQQVEIHVATSEARAEACEKAHKHYASQTEQAQQQLVTQLDQTNTQLSHIHAQLLAREQDLHRTEQRLVSLERIETLVQECMTQLTSQQQELKATVTTTHGSDRLSAERLETALKDALTQLTSHQQELKAAVVATQGNASLVTERVETALKDAMAHLVSHQQELKASVATTQESASLVAPVDPTVRDALAHLASQQQELKATLLATQGHANLSAERVEKVLKDALAQIATQQQELKASIGDTQGHANLSTERVEKVLKDALAQIATQYQELKASIGDTQGHANLSTERVEKVLKDALAQIATQQQELKASIGDTKGHAHLVAERGEAALKDAMAQLASHQQELKAAVLDIQGSTTLSAERLETLVKETIALLTNPQQVLTLELLFKKVSEQLTSAFASSQAQLFSDLSHALKQETPPLVALLTDQGKALQRLNEEFNAVGARTVEAIGSAVTTHLDKGQEETVQRLSTKLENGHEHLLERTQHALNQWQEQLMRVTGESQRLAIEYIVRELTTKMQELKTTLEKHLATPPPPTVKRTYVEAEVVEVTPPERPHKKAKPSPEVSEPAPTPHDAHASRQHSNPSMADIEQQARRELERLGAQGMNIFKRKS
jgi:pyrrolidone-carboxylate peptidase